LRYIDTRYVYFVRCSASGLIKIGYSASHPDRRLCGLRGASATRLEPIGYIPGDRSTEGRIHAMFAADRDHGEWFRPSDRLLYFVRRWVQPWPSPRESSQSGRDWARDLELASSAETMGIHPAELHRRRVLARMQPRLIIGVTKSPPAAV
jgi:hypothetical protein